LAWTVTLAPAARKSLRAIRDRRLRGRIVRALEALAADPRPAGMKRLVGQEGLLRVRVGDWRIVYEVREREVVVVMVVRIGPRGEVYERLG
jgi:mRNA interferase RelE/StbE